MIFGTFWDKKEKLEKEYENVKWSDTGLPRDELLAKVEKLFEEYR